MTTRHDIEAALRQLWGNQTDEKMNSALTAYDNLDKQARAHVDKSGDYRDIAALAAMGSTAYSDRTHAQHGQASQEVNDLFARISTPTDPNLPPIL